MSSPRKHPGSSWFGLKMLFQCGAKDFDARSMACMVWAWSKLRVKEKDDYGKQQVFSRKAAVKQNISEVSMHCQSCVTVFRLLNLGC